MSFSAHLPEQPPWTVTPPHELVDWLAGAATAVGFGVAIGVVAARMLSLARLRWSWAALALAATFLLHRSLGTIAPPMATAAFVATRRARRRHLQELDAGADLADRAAARRGPSHLLRTSLTALELRRRRRGGDRGWSRGDELIIGVDDRRSLVSVPFGGARGGTHMLVVGATGSGKTVTQTWTVVRAIELGMGAVVVDPKGDTAMRSALAGAAARCQRPLLEWTPEGPNVYNPFAHGGETEIADKLLAGERFSEPHYLRQAQRYVGHVVRALRGAGFEVSLQAVAHHLDPRHLERLLRELPADDAEQTRGYLDSLSARQIADLAGVRDRLAIVAESDVGRWLDPSEPVATRFDLLQAVRARAIVYFDLAADSRPLLTQMLGAAIVQDLTTTVAALQHAPVATVVVIDGNLTVLVAHRQVVARSAELVAGLAGTVGAWRTSRHGDERVTRTRVREAALQVDDVMRLGPGAAATIVLGAGSRASITRVLSLDPKERR
jgi:hypothetical protein